MGISVVSQAKLPGVEVCLDAAAFGYCRLALLTTRTGITKTIRKATLRSPLAQDSEPQFAMQAKTKSIPEHTRMLEVIDAAELSLDAENVMLLVKLIPPPDDHVALLILTAHSGRASLDPGCPKGMHANSRI